MIKYILKRVELGVLTLFIVTTFTFFLMYLVPGGPFNMEKAVSEQTRIMMEKKFGLDKPVPVQYVNYLKSIATGDFGMSLKQRGFAISDIIGKKFPVSAKLGGVSILVAVIVGVPVGCFAAVKRNSFIDKLISFFATLGIAVPSFVVCTFLMYFFSVKYKLLPTIGLATFKHYVMPVIALSFYPTAYIARLTRSSMLDVLGQDYMRTAKSKGVGKVKRIFKHALRNAVLPVITYLGPLLAYTLTGSLHDDKFYTGYYRAKTA